MTGLMKQKATAFSGLAAYLDGLPVHHHASTGNYDRRLFRGWQRQDKRFTTGCFVYFHRNDSVRCGNPSHHPAKTAQVRSYDNP